MRLDDLQTRHLRHFVAVAELNFGRAAERLHVAQPSVSRAVADLERILGVALLDRSTRHVELTPAGAGFLLDARAALGALGEGAEVYGLDASPARVVVGGAFFGGGPVRNAYLMAYRNSVTPDGNAGGDRGPTTDPGADTAAPRLGGLRLSPRSFRIGRPPRRGTKVSFELDEPAQVRFQVLVRRSGRRTAKGCEAQRGKRASRSRPCPAAVARGAFQRSARAGRSRITFTGRVGKRALARGRYRLTATATDAAGNTSRPRTASFRVLP